MASPGLWQQAAAFASGAEKDLDDWLAPVAVAAGLLGRPLSSGDADAVAGWLPGAAGRMSAQLTDVSLGVALAQPDGSLTDERLKVCSAWPGGWPARLGWSRPSACCRPGGRAHHAG